MFTHQHRLRHLLQPHHYFQPQHYARELKELFAPSWQFVGTKSEMANDGDFLTTQIGDKPILLHNFGGEIRGFVNVCPHRHSMLTEQSHGNCSVLRCQYHGWEFDREGRTGKIPEAKAFRPWDRENAHLERVRIDNCGDILLATLSEETPPLREWMDPLYEEIDRIYAPPMWRMRETWDFDAECNWKVPTENTLESYHVAAVHPTWFGGGMPLEKDSEHYLNERYTTLRYTTTDRIYQQQRWACKFLGGEPTGIYRHYLIHPNIVFCMTDTFSYMATYHPTSPTTCRIRTRMYGFDGDRRGPAAAFVRKVSWRIARKTMRMIFNEDRGIFPAQQRGLEVSTRPGVIGTREERIHVLQRFICDRMNLEIPPDGADELPAEIDRDQPVTA